MEFVELVYALREFNQWTGSKIQKIFQDNDVFVFHLYKSNVGKVFLTFKVPDVVYLSSQKPPISEKVSALGTRLRKFWTNGTLQSIEQVGHERIILLTISTKDQVSL